jgi:hypothetical protein
MWSSGLVKSVHHQIKKDMSQELSFSVIKERHQELMVDGVSFDMRALIAYLITSFGLEKAAKEGTFEIVVTVDGAKLDERTQHLTIDFKIYDKHTKDPVTVKCIYCNDDGEGEESHLDNLLSGSWCFPIISIIAKDNKETYEHYLRPIFEYCDDLRTVCVPELGWNHFLMSEPQNNKSCQLCLRRDGAAKSPGCTYFWRLCKIKSDDIAIEHQVTCTQKMLPS